MNYRTEFISRTKEIFEEAVNAQQIRKDADILLDNYFNPLFDALAAEVQATRGELKLEKSMKTYTISIKGVTLIVTNHISVIKVHIKRMGQHFVDEIDFTAKGYLSEHFNTYLSNELLDTYLKEAFDKVL